MSKKVLGFLAVTSVALAIGCEVQKDPNRNSGEDQNRLGAIEAPINKTIVDNVHKLFGDMTDWKYFYIPSPSLVELVVNFDNPNARAIAVIREATGVQHTLLEHRGEMLRTTFKAQPGIYYVEIFARQEVTDYTLEINVAAP